MSSRRYPDHPLVGVGAALFVPALDHVLLIQRGAPPAEGQWSLPGGLVEAGETLRRACAREIAEETGLVADLREVAKVVERVVHDDQGRVEYHYLIVDFWGLVHAGNLCASTDARAARWVPVAELAELPTTRGVPAAIQRALELARGAAPSSPVFEEP